jgi:methionyl-tRNA synthetase
MSKTIYITTPIYYINASPHIGHAYTTIASDVLARYYKLKNQNVFFLTGTDEHGQKIEEASKAKGKAPKQFADEIVAEYKYLWEKLDIKYDKFIRTTDDEHKKTVQKIFEIMYANGDIYKGEYTGLYCVPCETYFLETELADRDKKICPDCGRELKLVSEEAYFFKLSKYEDKLLKHFESNPDFLSPHFRSKEMLNFIKTGLRDLCVTRTAVSWGIPVPMDPKHSVYVWFDALINYISAIGYLDFIEGRTNNFNDIWPADIHFVGKEIYKFHTIIWPAILLSLDLPLPKKVFGHGWWTFEGEKMSKSKGNVIDPVKVISDYGRDTLKFFVLREIQFGHDGDFCMKNLFETYNTELANELGNLFSRTLKMLDKYCASIVPKVTIDKNILSDKSNEVISEYQLAMENIDFSKALNKTWELVRLANKYIEDEAPWKIAKNPDEKEKLEKVLFNIIATMRVISVLILPFMPDSSILMFKQLGLTADDFTVKKSEKNIVTWSEMPQDLKIGEVTVLFPRRENE